MNFVERLARWVRPRVPAWWRRSARTSMRWVLVGTFLGIGLGYLAFIAYLPSVSFPSTDRPTPLVILGVLFGLGVLAGFLSDDVQSVVVQSFLGVGFGILVDFVMIVSPAFHPGIISDVPSELLLVAIKFGLPIWLLSFLVWIVAGLVGLYLVDLFRRRLPASEVFPSLRENL